VTSERGQSVLPFFFRVVIFIKVYPLSANNFILSPTQRWKRHKHILVLLLTPLRVSQFSFGADIW